MRRVTLFIVLVLGMFLSINAQQFVIRGTVTDGLGTPLADVSIVAEETGNGTVSADNGQYELRLKQAVTGKITLKVSRLGYNTQQLVIQIAGKNGSTLQQNIVLVQKATELQEVIISPNTILGSKHAVLSRTGSAYFVSPSELNRFAHTDVNRVLANVPGVNTFEEDGLGLRPNISLRGSSPSRSSKITIMEDGILMAPAPYASPAAYYFPSIARMDAVEILKGSSQIQYGPFTTGGAINLVSAQIPTRFSGRLNAAYGSFNSVRLRATVGDSKKYFGYVVDYLKSSSDGFKKIDNQDKKGFDINDVMLKLRFNTDMEKAWSHALELKGQYSDENSDETYLGITADDFKATPLRRYAASAKDKMTTDHSQLAATYTLRNQNKFQFALTAYTNRFARNWYKLEGAALGANKPSLGNVLADPGKYPQFIALLRGEIDNADGALSVKANKRTYYSRGIQAKADYHFAIGETYNDVEAGLRFHTDGEDRFQWVDTYNMISGTMVLKKGGAPGSDANRITSARATSAYLLYKFRYKRLYVTPGLRYENIVMEQKDYGKKDPERTGGATLKTSKNSVGGTFIPGVGVNYRFTDAISVFGGVHRGFAPPGSKSETKPEKSMNYELGARFSLPRFYAEVVGYLNNYSNLLGSDMVAVGGTGTLNQFNAGKVSVNGVELLVNYDPMPLNSSLSLPISLGYTLTNSAFDNEFKSEIWDNVKKGYEIPYIAKHQLSFSLGATYKAVSLYANARYSSGFRTKAGTGTIPENQKAGNGFVMDAVMKYALTSNAEAVLLLNNAFNATYLSALSPYGSRPGMPRSVMLGVNMKL